MKQALTRRDFLKVSGGALAGAYVVGLTGCGGGGGGGGNGFSFVAALYTNPTKTYWNDLVADFKKKNPDADVDLRVIGWTQLPQQVSTMVTTGQTPELLNFNTYASFAADDLLTRGDEVISSELKGQFYENFYGAGSIDGALYGIPFIASIRNLYYNKEIFERVGIEKPPETWDELVQTAKAIKDETGIPGFGLPMTEFEAQADFSYFIWGNGGDWQRDGEWSFNIPENVEALQFMTDLVNKYKVTNSDPTTINRDELQKVFAQGQLGMMNTANFFPTILEQEAPDLDWDFGSIPRNEGVPEFSLGVEDFLMVFNTAENTEVIGKFLDFFYEKERYIKFLEQEGMLPTTKPVGETMSAQDPMTARFVDQLPKAKFYPLQDPQLDTVFKDLTRACQQALTGEKTPKQALDELQQTVTAG
ncbi:MAG TPA: extracellular solute-binding protein [Rubrobacteraceae bacterium]|nr:extracellular solute-binding protein [Rubrobacteraceae bacterium]